MRTSEDVYNRLLWNKGEFDTANVVIGYRDRFIGLQECTFASMANTRRTDGELFLPWHRVLYFRRGHVLDSSEMQKRHRDEKAEKGAIDETEFDENTFLWHRKGKIDRVFDSLVATPAPLPAKVAQFNQMCDFYLAKKCKKGAKCRYLHDERLLVVEEPSLVMPVDDEDDDCDDRVSSTGGGATKRAVVPLPIDFAKTVTWLLRHGNVDLQEDGFIPVRALLEHPTMVGRSELDVRGVVAKDEKRRFALKVIGGELCVRANQGHSVKRVREDALLTPIADPAVFPVVVHGTYSRHWPSIAEKGLLPMDRQHVHMCPGMPGDKRVVSGMRRDCDVIIDIDLKAAMAAGWPFFVSSNNVVLCAKPIPRRFFARVLHRKTLERYAPAYEEQVLIGFDGKGRTERELFAALNSAPQQAEPLTDENRPTQRGWFQ